MKRTLALLPLVFSAGACGPAAPAEEPANTAAPAEAAPPPTAQATPAETAAPAASIAPPATPPATPSPPAVTGTLAGKEFKAKAAITAGPLYNGRVLIAITDYDAACGKVYEPQEGHRSIAMQIEWKPGEVAFDGGKGKKGPLDPFYAVIGKDKQPKPMPFKSKGKVELAAAPTKTGESTRLQLDLSSGTDTVKGDIELHVCWDIKEEKK